MSVSGVSGGRGLRLWQGSAVVLVLGLVLGRLGPFDTFSQLPTAQRYAYWVGLLLLAWLQILAAARLLAGNRLTQRAWPVRAAVAALIGSIPTAFEVAWAESLLRVSRDLALLDVAKIYVDVLLICVPITLVLGLMEQQGHRSMTSSSAIEHPAGLDALLAEIPPERRGELIALSAEDHYLRVHTTGGEALILRRLSQAIDDVQALEGLRVHRGWWVARHAIEAIEQEGDRHLLKLKGGLRVPVSRTYLLAVREAVPSA